MLQTDLYTSTAFERHFVGEEVVDLYGFTCIVLEAKSSVMVR